MGFEYRTQDGALTIVIDPVNTIGAQIAKDEFRAAVPAYSNWKPDSAAAAAFSSLVVCFAHTSKMHADSETLPEVPARLLAFWTRAKALAAQGNYGAIWQGAFDALTFEDLDEWWRAYDAARTQSGTYAAPELQTTDEEAEGAGADFLADDATSETPTGNA